MATATWANSGGGAWFVAANWSEPNPNGSNMALHYVPGPTDDVTFSDAGPFTVTYDGTDSVDSIGAAETVTLAVGSGSLTVGAGGGTLGTLDTAAGGASFAIAGGNFRIQTAIDNAGTLALDTANSRSVLIIGLQTTTSPVSLTGGGNVTLSDSANNTIFIDNDASLDNVDNTISGAGTISANFATLINEAKGVIDATGTLNKLILDVPNMTNKGLIEDTGAAGLQLSTPQVSTTISNAGGTIAANGAGSVVDIGSGTAIEGGTLSTSGGGVIHITDAANGNILDGTSADGGPLTIASGSTVQLDDGAGLELVGTAASTGVIVNDGTIALDAGADKTSLSGHGGGTTMLTGGGKITLSDSANNLIGGGDFGTVFDNVNNTISGAGAIDSVAGRLTLINEAAGVIDATGANNALSVQNIDVTNEGLLEDTGGAGLTIADATLTNVGGTIAANGAGAHVDLDDNGIGASTIIGGRLSTTGGGVINVVNSTATLDASKGPVLVKGALAGAGTLGVSGGTATFASGTTLAMAQLSVGSGAKAEIATPLTYAGALANNGIVALDAVNTLELSGTVNGQGTVTFSQGAAATLQLDAKALPNGQSFANTIAGFTANDVIDLRGLTFEGNATPTYNGANGVLTVTEGTVTDTLTFASSSSTGFTLLADSAGGTEIVVCFAAGSRIRTPHGDVAVGALAVGDLVVTASGACRPIRWIGRRTIDCGGHPRPGEALPVRIAAHAFGPDRPARDLRVSPGHAICVDILGEVLIPAFSLINGSTIAQDKVDTITYFHVELDSHDILLAENLGCESYLDMGNRGFFGRGNVVALHASPDAPTRSHADFCRPFHADGPIVEAARARLDAIAESSVRQGKARSMPIPRRRT